MLGVIVLVVAFAALRHPHKASTAAGTDTRLASPSATGPTGAKPSGRSSAKSGAKSSPARTSASTSTGSVRRGALPLIILNASGTTGLVDQAKQRFQDGGWQVVSTDDAYQNYLLSTAAYYDPAVTNARAVAELLQQQYPTIKRVVPKFSGLPAGPIVVVLWHDYSAN